LSASAELLVYRRNVVSAVPATRLAGWVAGWLAVTRRYGIKTAKTILKLFQPSGSAVILVSKDPCADAQFQGAGALDTRGGKKWRFSTEIAVHLGNGTR